MNISEDAVRARSGETARWLVLNWHKLTDSALQEYLWAQFRGAALTAHEASSVRPDVAEMERLIRGYQLECNECEQIAGKALGYPWYKDDQKNCLGATEADGVCVGEQVPSSVVAELARRYTEANSVIPPLKGPEPDALAVIEAALRKAFPNQIGEDAVRVARAVYDKAERPTPEVAADTEALVKEASNVSDKLSWFVEAHLSTRPALAMRAMNILDRLIASLRKGAGT